MVVTFGVVSRTETLDQFEVSDESNACPVNHPYGYTTCAFILKHNDSETLYTYGAQSWIQGPKMIWEKQRNLTPSKNAFPRLKSETTEMCINIPVFNWKWTL